MPAKRYTAEDFVDAAMSLLVGRASDGFTLKEVGAVIGADTTAVYRHFPGKDALLAAMVDRVLADLVDPSTPIDEPRGDLERIAMGMREIHLRFPMLAATIAGIEVVAPNAIRLSRRVIDDLSALGLKGERLVAAYQALENFVLGSNWNDGVGRPNNWEIRRQRYELIERDHLSNLTTAQVGALSDRAYVDGVRALISAALVLDR